MSKIEKYTDTNAIFNNPFTQEIINRAWDIIKKTEPKDDYDRYILDVFFLVTEICNKFDDYNYTYLYLSNYPRRSSLKEKISHSNYIRYHTEIYVINSIAIFDRFLHLMNYLYDLKLEKLHLKLKNIEKSEKVEKDVLYALKKYNESISKIRDTQNDIKHRKSLEIPELEKISMWEFLLRHSNDIDHKDKIEFTVKFWIKNYLKKVRPQYLESNKRTAEFINNIFEKLYPIFQNNLSNLTQ